MFRKELCKPHGYKRKLPLLMSSSKRYNN